MDMSMKIKELVKRFNTRTERFKERAVQPPTPSSTDMDDKSSESCNKKQDFLITIKLVTIILTPVLGDNISLSSSLITPKGRSKLLLMFVVVVVVFQ